MELVCSNNNCPYHKKSPYCNKEIVFLNDFGMCDEWFDKRGNRYMQPKSMCYTAEEQQPPQQVKNDQKTE